MVDFDKDIVEDPLDHLDFVKTPGEFLDRDGDEREGPLVDVVNDGLDSFTQSHEYIENAAEYDKPASYHYADVKRGHWSASSGCSTQTYLNYVFKQVDHLKKPEPDQGSKRTFSHGDLVHLWIQGMFLEELGEEYVTVEETVDDQLEGDYGTAGHIDIVIRGHPDFPDPFVIDIKTKSEFTYYKYSKKGHARTIPAEKNLKQMMGYMYHVGAQYGALLYYSKRNDHIEEYWAKFDEELFEEGKDRITNVLEHVSQGSIPEPDGEPYLCNPEYCAYRREGICPGMEESDHHEPGENRLEEFEFDNPDWDE